MGRLLWVLVACSALACGHEPGFWCRADVPGTGCVYSPNCNRGFVPMEGTRIGDVTGCTYAPEHENGRCI